MSGLAAGRVAAATALAVTVFLVSSRTPAQPPAKVPSPTPAQKLPRDAEVTADGGINFYTTYKGRRVRSFAVTPQGSLLAGGVSRKDTPLTNEPPLIDPVEYDKAGAGGGRNWIHDFYFGRYEQGEGQPRLHTRGLIMWGRGDSPDIQLGRTGPDNAKTTYGPPLDTEPGVCLGKIAFVNWGEGEFQGDLAGMYARNDTVATKTRNPGSLHLATAGPSIGTEKEQARAWRDNIDRLVIRSNGYVGIGDNFTGAEERLHVKGNIRADGNVKASGDIVAAGAKKFEIDHPLTDGKKLVHAAIEGPEAAVYYRGEARLVDGRAVVHLPGYFEALTRKGQRTVMLTNVDGFDRLAVQTAAGMQVKDGTFTVVSDRPDSSQRFSWEVKAIRADVGPLEVER